MLTLQIFPWLSTAVWLVFLVFLTALVLRLVFNYSDPNPFGKIGRFSYHLKKRTDKFVYPSARFLANYGLDTRLAPLLTLAIAAVLTFFTLRIVFNTFFVIDGLSAGVMQGRPKVVVGFILYGALSVLILFIYIRFISSWFVFTRRTFLGFVTRVTNPILLPIQKLIPPIGMFDISALIVLICIDLLQSLVLKIFVYQ